MNQPCPNCGLAPLASREEWAKDIKRQEIGRRFANPETALPTYCRTCWRYQGLRLMGAMAERWLSDGEGTA